jgi:leucyl-tRNA synthetase
VKVLRDMGFVSFSEPFERLFTQGMITKDGAKMSKSKGNVVPPDALMERYGTDTVRLYTLFIGPPEKDAEWNDRGVEGAYRFLTKYWRLLSDIAALQDVKVGVSGPWAPTGPGRDLRRRVHQLVRQICDDMDRFHLNTAVSGLMQMMNALQDHQSAGGDMALPEVLEAADLATRLLAPLAPHTAEGAWALLGHAESVVTAGWPEPSAEALQSDTRKLVVQVNGKLRAEIIVPADADQDAIRQAALSDGKIAQMVEGKTVAKVIIVPGRLVNVVLR